MLGLRSIFFNLPRKCSHGDAEYESSGPNFVASDAK